VKLQPRESDRVGIETQLIETSLSSLVGRHGGGRVAVVAPGPSLRELQSLESFGAAFFIGDAHARTELRSSRNYYVRANSEAPRLDSANDMKPLLDGGFSLFIASSVMESTTSVEKLASRLPVDTTLFDQRHFGQQDCVRHQECCEYKIAPTIQEFFSKLVGWDHHYSQGPSVLLHALALAVMTQASEVVVFGVGLPLKQSDYSYLPVPGDAEVISRPLLRRINFRTVRNLFRNPRNLRFRLAALILGRDAPSILAEDFFELIADLQFISDAASQLGVRLVSGSSNSNLNRVHGFRY